MDDFLQQIRDDHHNFDKGILSDHVGKDPIAFFERWYKDAFDVSQAEPHAMSITTVDMFHRPSSRIVYLKELTAEGFVYFTNYDSQKGKELEINPYSCALFFWNTLERQVRIEGITVKADPAVSDAYFATRPRGSQLGAWASQQSAMLESREMLEKRIEELSLRFPGDVPRPPHWGGYILKPTLIEFWQGRPSRLHDRMVFEKIESPAGAVWTVFRKNP
jgi:pyridoxamine 5'-phosphate oxidase